MLVQISLLIAAASALPNAIIPNPNDPRFTQWKPPGAGDVRSPCPGLNSLANHGFIPHSGKGMTVPILIKGLKEGLNIGEDFSIAIGGAGVLSSPNPQGGQFDLDMLDQHNFPIEHDVSLSRDDAYFGDDHTFNQTRFNQVLAYYNGMQYTNIKQASLARYSRVKDSMARNPTYVYGPREFLFSSGETGLYIQTMSDPISGKAKLSYVRSLFEQEKLPYDLGWRLSPAEITLASLINMANELFAANPDRAQEFQEVLTIGAYKDILEGRDPITGILLNATHV